MVNATGLGIADAIESSSERTYGVLSLFSGCGGMDLGFEQDGFEIVAANELCVAAVETYGANLPAKAMVAGDITDPEVRDGIVERCGGRCDVIIGGVPCGPFSRSGKRDPNDPRARLFVQYLEMVRRLTPSFAIIENVQPLLSARNPSGGLVIDEIMDGFRRLGYAVQYKILNAADYGVAQCRIRIIIIATRLGVPIRFPEPTHAQNGSVSADKRPWRTIRNAIGDLENAPENRDSWHVFTRHSREVAKRYANTPIGQKGCVNYNEGFYRNPPDAPSVTIKTAAWPLHYLHGRDLTCMEAARVQSFPDSFRFIGGKTAVGVMIGNAVPPLLARAVATSVREMLDEYRQRDQVTNVAVASTVPQAVLPEAVTSYPAPAITEPSSKLLCNCSSKKGSNVWAFSIAMPGGKCPFASPICSKLCYAETGQFPLHAARYKANYQATTEPGFVGRICSEINALAWRYSGDRVAVCTHEKGELYSLDYLREWGQIIREMRSFPNLTFFVYTRSWINSKFRQELDRIAKECGNARFNLSVDRAMIEKHGLPKRVGDGLLVFLAETDEDLPPAGVDIVLRNLRIRDHQPVERLGDTLVCPNESGLFVAMEDGQPVVKGGKTIRIRCQDCRLCIDRGVDQWERIKSRYVGVPGESSDRIVRVA